MTLVYLVVAWLVGLIIGRGYVPGVWMVAGVALSGLALVFGPRRSRRRLSGWLLLSLVAGICRYQGACAEPGPQALSYYNDRGVVYIEGYVSAETNYRGGYTQLEIEAESIKLSGETREITGKALANVPVYPAYQYGDRVSVEANLETPPILDDFDYREYLASKGVHSLLRRPYVSRIPGQAGSRFLRRMFAVKSELRATIEQILPGAEAGLLSGILLGLSHTLPNSLYDAYRAAGLTHIIVISGFNMGLVAQAVMLVSRRLARRWLVLVGSLVMIALYTVFVGPSAPVVRATIMIGIALLGQMVGRKSHALTSLAVASWIMTAAQPLMLWSVSFQLSCVSALALIVLEPRLSDAAAALLEARFSQRMTWLPFVRDTVMATVAAQIATLPIIWYNFHELSVVALLANLLALPVQPAILVLGAIATALGSVWLPAGQLVGFLVWPFLRWTNLVVQFLGAPRWASIAVPRVPAGWFWAIVGVVGVWHLSKRQGVKPRQLATRHRTALLLGPPALLCLVIWAWLLRAPDGRLHVHMLDIGQGDAILITSPSGRRILVDGGPDPIVLDAQLGRVLPIGDRRIDVVVATHSDKDHLGGLLALARYDCHLAIESPNMSDSALCQAWHDMLVHEDIACMSADRGQRIESSDGVWMQVVHPDAPEDRALDDNQSSVVLYLHYGEFGMLLTGDIDQDTEALVIGRRAVEPVAVLKVAHHGAASSTGSAWLDATAPQIALVSAGVENRFGHPSSDTLDRLDQYDCLVLRTDQQGTCEIVTDGHQMYCMTQRPRKRSQ